MRKKRAPREKDPAASNGRYKAMQPEPAKDQKLESEAIERAVYDGMQDLRAEKPK
jgi:hypothetical protein